MSQFFASCSQTKYWSSFNISPSNEHPGLVSFRMGRLDLLAVQGTLKSLLQHHTLSFTIPLYRVLTLSCGFAAFHTLPKHLLLDPSLSSLSSYFIKLGVGTEH